MCLFKHNLVLAQMEFKFLHPSLLFAVQQFHTKQHSSYRDCDFIWGVHFAWRGSDTCKGIYVTFFVCSATLPTIHASQHNNSGFVFMVFLGRNFHSTWNFLCVRLEMWIFFFLLRTALFYFLPYFYCHEASYVVFSPFPDCSSFCGKCFLIMVSYHLSLRVLGSSILVCCCSPFCFCLLHCFIFVWLLLNMQLEVAWEAVGA